MHGCITFSNFKSFIKNNFLALKRFQNVTKSSLDKVIVIVVDHLLTTKTGHICQQITNFCDAVFKIDRTVPQQRNTQLPGRANPQLISLFYRLHTDDGPPARWIVNFDRDFVDGLVLAAVLAAYCPYLVSTALRQQHKPSLYC